MPVLNSDKLNLLFVFPSYEPAWRYGGIVRCTSNLCRQLVKQGHRVTVYTINSDGSGGVLDVPVGCPLDQGGVQTLFFLASLRRGSNYHSRDLINVLKRTAIQYDLVYVAATWQWLGMKAAAVCAARDIPLIIGLHGALDETRMQHHSLRKWVFWRLFLRKALQRSTALHFTTSYEREQSKRWTPNVPSFVVPNGQDSSGFLIDRSLRLPFRKECGIPKDVPVMITVGRIDPLKRIDALLKALSLSPEWYLLVVGSGDEPLENEWRKLATRLGVENRVVWTGHLDHAQLASAYNAADLFALISRDENFGMVAIEALAYSLPVLLTPQVGVSGDFPLTMVGTHVSEDPHLIATELNGFLTNSDVWQARAAQARTVAVEHFDIQHVANLTAQAFYNVLHKRASLDTANPVQQLDVTNGI